MSFLDDLNKIVSSVKEAVAIEEAKLKAAADAEAAKKDAPKEAANTTANVATDVVETAPDDSADTADMKDESEVVADEGADETVSEDEAVADEAAPVEAASEEVSEDDKDLENSISNVFEKIGDIFSGKKSLSDIVGEDVNAKLGQTKWAKDFNNINDPDSPYNSKNQR